ncbi:YjjW family glycine radical enzyme activase [Tissierella sp. MB52-C2]|uniref:YjjW family glycine radical enzyme activase n=1 Tax=Tissierella sp. MB52-C2 TaxID=3070999 RepID=UPI00280AF65F|nr:YjjW family glycine radical enzyme activase [Tissierella sp. MB52-C2]WMM24781.1 YjjW family glycine radical enzyme activase [Tissierella sp. MB52-C2]
MCKTATINKIIPMSLVDGPGNRTAIFFQGCNFNCSYCHNPETIKKCINCGVCVSHCPVGALKMIDGKAIWDENKCIDCDTCIKVCPHGSTPKTHEYTVDDLMEKIEENIPFIEGITTSGGECTLNFEFLEELFTKVKSLGLTSLVDTNGFISLKSPIMDGLVKAADGFMLDIKSMNEDEHIKLTGRSNKTVIENAVYLASIGKLQEIRTVLIEGHKNRETVENITKLLKPYPNLTYKLISYRPFGVREEFLELKSIGQKEKEELKEIVIANGIKVIDC